MQVKAIKKSAMKKAASKGAGPPATLVLLDNEDGTGVLMGETKGGNLVDISDVATLSPEPSSADTSVATVAVTEGMSFKVSAVGPIGSTVVTVTATWNDGSMGPFGVDIPVDVKAGPVAGVVVAFGPPTPH